MTLAEVLQQLESVGTEQNRNIYRRHGAGDVQFGVSFGNLNKMAKAIKRDHSLALELWETGNADARSLATLVADPTVMTVKDLDSWVKDISYYLHADLVARHVAAKSPHARALMLKWMKSREDFCAQVGWDLLALQAMDGRVKDSEADAYLKTIETRIQRAKNRTRHAMNNALIALGLRSPKFQKKAIAAARRVGKVEVDHGETNCETPDAEKYIRRAAARKRKRA